MAGTMTSRCGMASGYADHLRAGTPTCAACRRRHAETQARWKKRAHLARGPLLVDSTGTRRRLQALAALGWGWTELGARIHVQRSTVGKWVARDLVHRGTATRVAQLYTQLHDLTGPSPVVARRAAAAGWPPPIAWDDDTIDDPATQPYAGQHVDVDEVAVARALAGHPVTLARAEQLHLAQLLTDAGRSAAHISTVLGVEARTVQRWRAAA